MNRILFIETARLALQSIFSQKLRTALTAIIIAIGIMALVGILTAIDSLKNSINNEFTLMGSNSFNIRKKNVSGNNINDIRSSNITYKEASDFIARMEGGFVSSISVNTGFTTTLRFEDKKTNPNIALTGVGENYLQTSGLNLSAGRDFNTYDIENYAAVCIIGKEIKDKLFNEKEALQQFVSINGKKFQIIGVLEEKGSSVGFSGDRNCLIPVSTARTAYLSDNTSFQVTVLGNNPSEMETAIGKAYPLMRQIRKDPLRKEASFEIRRSDNLVNILIQNLQYVSVAATLIAIITLLGASVALVNIMLVSVKERTKEIGTRKAVGAKKSVIRNQFLLEAIFICLSGGFAGIFLGVLVGNIIAVAIGGSFFLPMNWITAGFASCTLVGILSGYYPARKAANLDPIEALRYE